MGEKPSRSRAHEAVKRQNALYRLMFWCAEIERHYSQLKDAPAKVLSGYDDKVSVVCLLKNVNQLRHFYQNKVFDPEFIHDPAYMKLLLFKIYYAELHINPWGIATQRLVGREVRYQGKTILASKLPNFLLPTGCLYCGGSLGFSSYKESSTKITKHPECANPWNKGLRKKHLEALGAMHTLSGKRHDSAEVLGAFDYLLASYEELVPLYQKTYQPRYTLVKEYQDIPNEAWVDPICGIEPRAELLDLPFLIDDVHEFALALSEESDGDILRWNPYNPETDQRAISLRELDNYFLKNP